MQQVSVKVRRRRRNLCRVVVSSLGLLLLLLLLLLLGPYNFKFASWQLEYSVTIEPVEIKLLFYKSGDGLVAAVHYG